MQASRRVVCFPSEMHLEEMKFCCARRGSRWGQLLGQGWECVFTFPFSSRTPSGMDSRTSCACCFSPVWVPVRSCSFTSSYQLWQPCRQLYKHTPQNPAVQQTQKLLVTPSERAGSSGVLTWLTGPPYSPEMPRWGGGAGKCLPGAQLLGLATGWSQPFPCLAPHVLTV